LENLVKNSQKLYAGVHPKGDLFVPSLSQHTVEMERHEAKGVQDEHYFFDTMEIPKEFSFGV
jgi:hypothetical protein